jgi:thiol-disulfide isomerase/thioredoxin
MKYIATIALAVIGAFCGICSAAAAPETLTLSDLVNHPDRWPPSLTLTRDFKFANGAVLHQGDKVRVGRFDGVKVGLFGPGNLRFSAKPEDCGLLEAANAAWSKLTPAQRAVDTDSIASDVSLWPVNVAMATSVNSPFGKLSPGTEVLLLSVSNKGPEIEYPHSINRVAVDFDSTDVLERARELALVEPDKRPSRIAEALKGLMVDADGKPYHDDHLGEKKIFALYFGASWCPPCHAFSPDFVKFLNDAMPRHPELAVVMLSNDQQPGPMLGYMKEEKMPFPAVPLTELNRSTLLLNYAAKMIPELVIVDRFGKQLASNDDRQGNRGDPKDTIAALGKLLASPAEPK